MVFDLRTKLFLTMLDIVSDLRTKLFLAMHDMACDFILGMHTLTPLHLLAISRQNYFPPHLT